MPDKNKEEINDKEKFIGQNDSAYPDGRDDCAYVGDTCKRGFGVGLRDSRRDNRRMGICRLKSA